MAIPKKTTVAIIGGGIAGLTVAAFLEKAGIDYLLIEAQSEWGGLAKGQKEKEIWLDFGLKSIPVGPDLKQNPLLEIKKELNLSIGIESWNESPKTFQTSGSSNERGIIDFVGFGDVKARTLVEELSYYTETPRLMVSGGWKNLVDGLLQQIPPKKCLLKSIVTKLDITEDQVTTLTLNGDTTLKADHFVFTLSPTTLRHLLPLGAVSGKILQRIARTTPWTAVSLDIVTDTKTTDAKNLFVLSEPSKEKNEDPFFMIGQFISNVDPIRYGPHGQLSTWMTFVDPEFIEDDESGSQILKKMKKLIKKAFPPLVDLNNPNKNWERILVVPQAVGHFSQLVLEENGTLPGLGNFWICGGQVPAQNRNLCAALEQAKAVGLRLSQELSPKTEIAEAPIHQENSPEA